MSWKITDKLVRYLRNPQKEDEAVFDPAGMNMSKPRADDIT
jgi:hypothetical protein